MKGKRQLVFILIFALLLEMVPFAPAEKSRASTKYEVNNPVISGDITKWDCIYFGHYPQSDAAGNQKDPVKWRVLNVDGDDAFLMADKNLDVYRYHQKTEAVVWKNSDIRRWLNNDFFNLIFSDEEKEAVKKTVVVNSDNNPEYGTDGGENTEDYVYLLSIREAMSTQYGFSADADSSDTRIACNTAYVSAGGHSGTEDMEPAGNSDFWWLRSSGDDHFFVANAEYDGAINMFGIEASSDNFAVRPVLHLDLSKNVWTRAGIVCSDGENIEIPYTTPDKDRTPEPALPTQTDDSQSQFTATPGASSPKPTFNESVYRATKWYKESCSLDDLLVGEDTPAVAIHKEAERTNLDNWNTAWITVQDVAKAVLDSPASLIDRPMKEVELYEGLIFALMDSSSDKLNFPGRDIVKKTSKEVNDLVDLIKTMMKTVYNIKVADSYDLSTMTDEQKESMWDMYDEYFKSFGIEKFSKYIGNFGKAIGYYKTLEDFVNYCMSCISIMRMCDSYKSILQDMYDSDPGDNIYLHGALKDCVTTMNMSEEQFFIKICSGARCVIGKEVVKYGIKSFWSDVKKDIIRTNPYIGWVWVAYKGANYFCDKVLSVNTISEKTVKLGALADVQKLIYSAYNNARKDFGKDMNVENADKYLSAINVFYNYLNEDCDAAYKYVETIANTLALRINELFGSSERADKENTMRVIDFKKNFYIDEYKNKNFNWLYDLEREYPEQYDRYKDVLKEWEEKYLIACPVDVYIYDKNDVLVASVINDIPYCDDISRFNISVEDGEKEIVLYDDSEQYTFKYVATDSGTMDITIEKNNDESTVIKHIDVPLSAGKIYTSKDNLKSESNTYELTEENGNNIKPVLNTADKSLKKYKLIIENGYVLSENNQGTTGDFYPGEKIIIYANVPEGGICKGWETDISDNIIKDLQTETVTIIMPAKDVKMKAVVTEKNAISESNTDSDNGNSSEKKTDIENNYQKKQPIQVSRLSNTGKIKAVKLTIPKKIKIKAGKRKAILSWKKVFGASGYQLQYSTSKKFAKKETKAKKVKKTKITIKKLKKKKNWYFRIRAYNRKNGKKNYGSWSRVMKVKIK